MPSVCRSFNDLLVVKISGTMITYWVYNSILCPLSGNKGLKYFLKTEGGALKHKMQRPRV